jgi:hypothetical protein
MFQNSIDHSDEPQSHVINSELFMPRAKGAVFLVPSDHSFDDIALPIQRLVEPLVARLVFARWDDCFDSPPTTPEADARIAVTLVPRQVIWPTAFATAAMKQSPSHRRLERFALVRLPGRKMEGNDPPVLITNQVDLGRESSTRAPQRMVKRLLHLRLLTPTQPLRVRFAPSRTVALFSPRQRLPYLP